MFNREPASLNKKGRWGDWTLRGTSVEIQIPERRSRGLLKGKSETETRKKRENHKSILNCEKKGAGFPKGEGNSQQIKKFLVQKEREKNFGADGALSFKTTRAKMGVPSVREGVHIFSHHLENIHCRVGGGSPIPLLPGKYAECFTKRKKGSRGGSCKKVGEKAFAEREKLRINSRDAAKG